MRFGARKAEPTHEPVIEEAPTKKYEVLPRKLPQESGTKPPAERSSGQVRLNSRSSMSPKGTTYKVFTGGGTKFGQEKPSSPRARPNSSEQEQQEVLPRRVSWERGMKFDSKKSRAPPKARHQGEMKLGGKPNSSAHRNKVRRKQG
ncbi:hypothetical protein COCNU_14G003810 [Cocos nucifera]|uniref:Uncharacterized protein n=1 Tax=Cocos nucifera TaxID=13894 RepID=A0A8K0IUW3_COCNU|nr:hypothetical protein COCNU_14G003810 [Cocos nucifera]